MNNQEKEQKDPHAGLDWVIISLSIAGLMVVSGIGALMWMLAHRDYWASDPALPAGFAGFSKMITLATLGALAIILGLVVAVAALVCWVQQRQIVRLRADLEAARKERVDADVHLAREMASTRIAMQELVELCGHELAEMRAAAKELTQAVVGQQRAVVTVQAEQAELRARLIGLADSVQATATSAAAVPQLKGHVMEMAKALRRLGERVNHNGEAIDALRADIEQVAKEGAASHVEIKNSMDALLERLKDFERDLAGLIIAVQQPSERNGGGTAVLSMQKFRRDDLV